MLCQVQTEPGQCVVTKGSEINTPPQGSGRPLLARGTWPSLLSPAKKPVPDNSLSLQPFIGGDLQTVCSLKRQLWRLGHSFLPISQKEELSVPLVCSVLTSASHSPKMKPSSQSSSQIWRVYPWLVPSYPLIFHSFVCIVPSPRQVLEPFLLPLLRIPNHSGSPCFHISPCHTLSTLN